MSLSSTVPRVIDALVASLTAGLPGIAVYDGPQMTDAADNVLVAVGYDGDENSDAAADFTQTWAGLGAKARDEMVDVTCCVVAFDGGEGIKVARDAAYTAFTTVEALLRANAAPGTSGVIWQEVTGGRLFQDSTTRGVAARIVFTVHARSRI